MARAELPGRGGCRGAGRPWWRRLEVTAGMGEKGTAGQAVWCCGGLSSAALGCRVGEGLPQGVSLENVRRLAEIWAGEPRCHFCPDRKCPFPGRAPPRSRGRVGPEPLVPWSTPGIRSHTPRSRVRSGSVTGLGAEVASPRLLQCPGHFPPVHNPVVCAYPMA